MHKYSLSTLNHPQISENMIASDKQGQFIDSTARQNPQINFQMQKGGSTSKKPTSVPSVTPTDQYRSESSKASSNAPKKQGFAFQNMKQFKCEIDHQIAKCLDTLDRQGLKFLKETLRASKIFGLNTQELGNSEPLEEEIEGESGQKIKKEKEQVNKKVQPQKNNVQTKKVTKVDATKKVQPAASAKKNEQKGDLNEKINKKLDSLNIKTGKKNQPKGSATTKKNINHGQAKVEMIHHNQIAEEIQIQQVQQKPQQPLVQEPKLPINYQPEKTEINPHFYQSNKQWLKSDYLSSSLESKQKNNDNTILKPFCKKQFKKHHEEGKHKQHKDYGIQISKPDQFRRSLKDQSLKEQLLHSQKQVANISSKNFGVQQSSNQPYQSSSQLSKDKHSVKIQEQPEDPNLLNLLNAITRLSPNKRNKLERIIEKLQHSDKLQSTSSLLQNPSKAEVSYQKPYIAQRQSFTKISQPRESNSNSKSRVKQEKATSLKTSLVKKINYQSSQFPQNHGSQTPTVKRKQGFLSPALPPKDTINPMWNQQQAKSQMISQIQKEEVITPVQEKVEFKSSSSVMSENASKSLLSNENGQKLIKISKKKNMNTIVTFKILSNNGHSSLVGLTSIQLFNHLSQMIPLDQSNFKTPNLKLSKLFTDNTRGDGWIVSLSNSAFCIQISSQLAGIRIINLNKSQLQIDRQAQMIQVWINDQLHWRGNIKGGSFKENQIYATNIKVTQKHFQFPQIKRQMDNIILNALSVDDKSSSKIILSPLKHSIKHLEIVQQDKKEKPEVHWLEKETVEKKMREIQEQQKNEEKIKKIGSVRNTGNTLNINVDRKISPQLIEKTQKIEKQEKKPFSFGLSWLNEDLQKQKWFLEQSSKQKKEEVKLDNESKNILNSLKGDDILGQFSKSIDTKRKKQEMQVALKQKQQTPKLAKQDSYSRKKQELLLKQKEQDDQFQKILQSMQERSKPKQQPKLQKLQPKLPTPKAKVLAQKSFQDFMKDSLFDDKPLHKFQSKPIQAQPRRQEPTKQTKPIGPSQLDELIDQLNIVGEGNIEETGEEFYIPQLPAGRELSIFLFSNWGHQSFIGLNGIQLFDSSGEVLRPIGVSSSGSSSKEIFQKLFKQQLLTSDEKAQLKIPKGKKVAITLTFSQRIELAAMRIWNYNGHRVHNNIGVKKLGAKLDGSWIFSGEVRQGGGASDQAYKHCQYILFTQNGGILKRIGENDWLTGIVRRGQEENRLFRDTLQNFPRPNTSNQQEKKTVIETPIKQQPIKIPKRIFYQFQPPILPQGFTLKCLLHSSWGDRFFIGLNGIEIFNEKGQNIIGKVFSSVRADPSSLNGLRGYQKDQRVASNLLKGKNTSISDSNSWLAPLLTDIQKIQQGRSNIIQFQSNRPVRISAINFYNYAKTPLRGVRQIQIFLDESLLYRGYLRRYDPNSTVYTTIAFTKEQGLLQAIGFSGYNQDHMEQEVGLINQEKVLKATILRNQGTTIRPMTGKGG